VLSALLGLTIGLAALIRFAHLAEKSIWSDEAFSIFVAKLPWADFWHVVTTNEPNMSFYYLLLRFWVRFGDHASYVRLFSALAGVASVPVIFWIGREVSSRRAGIFASLLLSVNVFHIRYSQEARSYGLVVFLVALSFLSFFRCLLEDNRYHFWSACYVLSSAVALYTHFFAALALLAQGVTLAFLPRPRQIVIRQVQYLSVTAVLGTPLLWFVLFKNHEKLDWMGPASAKDWYHFFLYLTGSGLQFGIAVVSFGVALTVWVARCRKQQWTVQTWSFGVLLLWLFLPVCATFLFSLWKPVFLPRFLILCLPAALLLVACGIVEISHPWIRYALVTLLLLSSVAPIRSYYSEPGQQDWRGVVGYVAQNARAGDIAVLSNEYCERPLRYHIDHSGQIPGFPTISSTGLEGTPLPRRALNRAGNIWVIRCTAAAETPPAIPGYAVEEIRQFQGIRVFELGRKVMGHESELDSPLHL
jgi:hypothetical protein